MCNKYLCPESKCNMQTGCPLKYLYLYKKTSRYMRYKPVTNSGFFGDVLSRKNYSRQHSTIRNSHNQETKYLLQNIKFLLL